MKDELVIELVKIYTEFINFHDHGLFIGSPALQAYAKLCVQRI